MNASVVPTGPFGLLRIWFLAVRPKTLVAAVVPVAVGTAVALRDGGARPHLAVLALLGAVFIQVGTNLVNDVCDFRRGADTEERLGPMRVTQAGLVSQRAVTAAAVMTFAAALICGGLLTYYVGWPILALGVVSVGCGIAYTAGPHPLAYRGLGDLFVFLFFGLVATVVTHWLQVGEFSWLALVLAASIGAISTCLIVVNNLRDIEGDEKVGKRTLAVRLGRAGTILEYRALIGLAFLLPLVAWFAALASPTILISWLALPLALPLARRVGTLEGRELNSALAHTARLLMVFGVLLCVGVLW